MFRLGEVDVKALQGFGNMIGALGDEGPKAVNRALNRSGDMARTQVVRELAKQTGLMARTIRKAVKTRRGTWERLEYTLYAEGGDVSLKFFKPRETRRGVVAQVRGARTLYERSFLKGGSFKTGRVALKLGGHVFERDGARTNLTKLKSGVYIPEEMITGATRAAWDKVVVDVLPRRLDHEISRALGI